MGTYQKNSIYTVAFVRDVPVSALLFILCMEVLSCYLRQNMNIRGLDIDGNETKQIKIIQ